MLIFCVRISFSLRFFLLFPSLLALKFGVFLLPWIMPSKGAARSGKRRHSANIVCKLRKGKISVKHACKRGMPPRTAFYYKALGAKMSKVERDRVVSRAVLEAVRRLVRKPNSYKRRQVGLSRRPKIVGFDEVRRYLRRYWVSLTRGAKVPKRWIPSRATFYNILSCQKRPVNRHREKVMMKNCGASQEGLARMDRHSRMWGNC